jgi:thiamine biosynthesis lipoprotein
MRLSLCLSGAVLLPAAVPLPAPASSSAKPVGIERRLAVMGTSLSVAVEGPDRASALAASEAAVSQIERVEALLSTWKRGGPLDRLNRAAPRKQVAVGREAARLIETVFAWRTRTGRAFDPTVLPLVRAWDLRGEGRVPSAAEVTRTLQAVGSRLFDVDASRGTARRLDAAAGIDEGAWGKGYALDCAAAALRGRGISRATLDLGGQVLVLGRGRVGIADPRDRSRIAASVDLADGSVSTSGNSERAVTVAGRRVGHLLDPRTGSPAPDFGSATVAADSAFVADVLSTAFFVLGPKDGMDLSDRLASEGLPHRALFLVVTGGGVRCVASAGWKPLACGGTF